MKAVGNLLIFSVTVMALFLTVSSLEAEIVQKCINTADGFSIEFPPGWLIRENPAGETPLFAFRPKEKSDEVVFERIDIIVLKDAGEGQDVFYQKQIENLKSMLPDFTLVAKGNEDFPAMPSSFLIYTFTDKFITLQVQAKAKQWIIRGDDRVYLITGTAKIDTFPKYEPIFQKIVSSFQILK